MLFAYKSESEIFGQRLLDLAVRMHRSRIASMVPPENMYSFRHGRRWLILREDGQEEGAFKPLGIDLDIQFDWVAQNDVSKFFQFIENFVQGFTDQMMQQIYKEISQTCEAVGNTIDRNNFSSNAEALVAMLERVELAVSRDGKVHLPEIHMGTDAANAFTQDSQLDDESLIKRVEGIIEEKTKAAYAREQERLQKFKGLRK